LSHFFVSFFFNLILQYWVDWELVFIIHFNLFFTRLSWSHNSGHEFSKLTRVDSSYFFVLFLIDFFLISFSTFSWLGITLHNLFLFSFYGIIIALWPRLWILQANQINSGWSDILSSQYFKRISSWDFLVKLHFY